MQHKFNHEYHRSLVYKIMNAKKPDVVLVTFEDSLDMIKRIHKMTGGLKQIVYLTGWQYDGHDSKYPAWHEVNHRLARPQDKSPRDSFLWLVQEAKKYNAIVSVHVNMCDAYENSPLWKTYYDENLLIRDKDGNLVKGGVWDGDQSYLVSKAAEWRSGRAKERIDYLIDLLQLAEVGTVHIDVFHPRPSEYHGITYDDDVVACQEILKYFISRGVEVTNEWFHHEYAGLMPYAWHFNLDERSRLKYPPSVITGGGPGCNLRWARRHTATAWPGWFTAPEAGCLYEDCWGTSIDGEPTKDLRAFTHDFFTRTLQWHFLNNHRVIKHVHTPEVYEVYFEDDVVTSMRTSDRHFTLTHQGRVLREQSDLLIPALWLDRTLMGYSENGCTREWELSADWADVSRAKVTTVTPAGNESSTQVPVVNGRITLTLEPRQGVMVTPM